MSKYRSLIEQAKTEKRCIHKCIDDVVMSHDQAFSNYIWLQPYYGKLLWVDFEEPAGSGV